jgi:hypothetical protein
MCGGPWGSTIKSMELVDESESEYMQSRVEIHTMTRRAFAKFVAMGAGAGAAVLRAASGPARSLAAEQPSLAVYAFYPLEEGELRLCKACLGHAQHKRFATRDAAEANRAHKGCNCPILTTQVSTEEFAQLFGGTGGVAARSIYDLRWSSTPHPAST